MTTLNYFKTLEYAKFTHEYIIHFDIYDIESSNILKYE